MTRSEFDQTMKPPNYRDTLAALIEQGRVNSQDVKCLLVSHEQSCKRLATKTGCNCNAVLRVLAVFPRQLPDPDVEIENGFTLLHVYRDSEPCYAPPRTNLACECWDKEPFAAFNCPFGHMTDCHFPLLCKEAECGHVTQYRRREEK
jgi:hypothetical protein